jgi:hypothetical protein
VLPGNLEIDGYNDELKLGFEYNGEQHYRYVNYFHKNQEDFLKRKNDDNLKKKLAIESNIALIIIPYTKSKNDEMLFNYIKEKLSEKNFVINKSFNDINFSVFYSNSQQLEEARTLAKNRGGECLSDVFNGAHEKLTWKCSKGHIWDQSLSVVKSGSWCNSCNGTPKGTIEEMIELATSFNGFCLSDEYINTTYKLKWKCQEGHIFEKEPLKIRKGKWCPKCTRKKRKKYKNTIEDLQEFAKTKNGKCLSNEYFHKDHKYEWECEKGHRWFASFGSVKNSDTWCKTCSQNERKVSYRKNKNL